MKQDSVFDRIVEEFTPPAPKPAPTPKPALKPAPRYGPVIARSRQAGKSDQINVATQFRAPITCIDACMLITDDVLTFEKAEVERVMRRELLTQIVNQLLPEVELRTDDDPIRRARRVAMRLHVILPKHFKGYGDNVIFPIYQTSDSLVRDMY